MRFQGPRRLRCPEHGAWVHTDKERDYHVWLRHRQGGAQFEEWDRCAVCGLWVCVAEARQHACTEAQGPSLTGLVLALLGVVVVVLGALWLMGGGR